MAVEQQSIVVGSSNELAGTHPFWHYFFPKSTWGVRDKDGKWYQPMPSLAIILGRTVNITPSAREVLEKTTAEFYYVENASSWGYYDDLAQALQLHIYIGKGKQLIIDYQGGA